MTEFQMKNSLRANKAVEWLSPRTGNRVVKLLPPLGIEVDHQSGRTQENDQEQ
jgi:hypothetical protein